MPMGWVRGALCALPGPCLGRGCQCMGQVAVVWRTGDKVGCKRVSEAPRGSVGGLAGRVGA